MSGCNMSGCNPCQKGCKPARYSQGFGNSSCDCPPETDTKLSIDTGGATLNYSAERHTDKITGQQLGSIINLPDLRDVDIDYDIDAMCAEFIYHKYGDCGDGCRSAKDAWTMFTINDDGAKQNAIRYVRGANAYGCPVFLDVPSNPLQYWYAGWRTDGDGNKQFGYYQAEQVPELPKDNNGNTIVISQKPNGQPVVGPINFKDFYDEHYCTFMRCEPGFYESSPASNLFCYYPNRGQMLIALDILCNVALPGQVLADKKIGTIDDPRFWPAGIADLPVHAIYQNNTDGKITPIWIRINPEGEVTVTGEITTRTTSGKASYIIIGVDDAVLWEAQGDFS